MKLISRKVDSPAKILLLIAIFVLAIASFVIQYFEQRRDLDILLNILPSEVIEVSVSGISIIDNDSKSLLINSLKNSTLFSPGEEGCLHPIRIRIALKSDIAYNLGVAYSTESQTAVIQFIGSELPSCLYENRFSNDQLPEVLSALGINIE